MVNNLNKSKWFGSRPVLCFMPEDQGGGGGTGGGSGDGGTGGGAGGSGGAGGAAGGAGGGGAGSGGTAGGAGGSGQDGSQRIDWKTAPEQFRKGYDELKSKYEPWEKLNLQPDQVGQFHGTYQKLTTTALKIGQELGYDKDEILEVLHEDPIKTLNFLQNKWAEAQAGGGDGEGDEGAELADLVQEHITKALGPIQQRENQRMTQEANNLFERTVHTELSTIFKEEGVDITKVAPEEQFMLVSAASEIMKYDAGALHGLKYEGKTAPIQKAVREAKTFLDKYFMARATRERGAVAGGKPGQRQGQQPGQQDGGKRPTLDELIENPALINARYAEGR